MKSKRNEQRQLLHFPNILLKTKAKLSSQLGNKLKESLGIFRGKEQKDVSCAQIQQLNLSFLFWSLAVLLAPFYYGTELILFYQLANLGWLRSDEPEQK